VESIGKEFFPELKYELNGRKALDQMSEIISQTTKNLESVFDHHWIHILVENSMFFNTIADFKIKQKGVSIRFITNITSENVLHCTKIMKFVELRHADTVTGYLGISDKNQFFSYTQSSSKQNNHLEKNNDDNLKLKFIHITNKEFVQMQYYFFEKLWNLSIPASEKIAEIQRVMFDTSLLNTNITDSRIIVEIFPKVIRSAVEEILLFFPTIDSFWFAESNGIIKLLGEAINRFIKVKVLIRIDNENSNIKKEIERKINETNKILGTYVNYTTKKIDTKTIVLVTDQAISFSISIKYTEKGTFKDSIEMASFSNNELNVSALLSFFDSLWIRSDIEKQNIIKQTYFKIFKEPQLKDENYRRKWFFEPTKKE
jgi:hypothetical protein